MVKKLYKLNIIKNNNTKKMTSLLDLRTDNDWVLNSIHSDSSYIREKIAFDIWNLISSKYNTELRYVEVVLDNSYKGIYLLEEPVDMKTFDASKNTDMLISIKYWMVPEEKRTIFNNVSSKRINIDQYEITAGLEDNFKKQIEILQTFDNSIRNIDYKSDISLTYNLENSADYELFINLLLATDNKFKNEKIIFRKTSNNSYLIEKTPWDLDWSMYNESFSSYFNINTIVKDTALPKEIRENEQFLYLQKSKYFKIRETFYNEESLNTIVDSYANYLINSGASFRNSSKWNIENFEDCIQNVKDFFKNRIRILDKYYGGI